MPTSIIWKIDKCDKMPALGWEIIQKLFFFPIGFANGCNSENDFYGYVGS